MNKVLVMSIKPKYASKIYSGTKIFEFRKAPPRNLSSLYLLYESAPVSKITGYVVFDAALTVRAGAMVESVQILMKCTKDKAIGYMGISEDDLISYAGGTDSFVTALMVGSRTRSNEFEKYHIHPPQNWGTIKATFCKVHQYGKIQVSESQSSRGDK